MTELDLGLKVASRRMLWRMGYSTRIDVPLRAVGPSETSRGRSGVESFTDLDVLGVTLAPGAAVESAIVDCKTGGSSAISRMFWVRGVSDFFGANAAYMVREREISRGARQLANRLGITALVSEEVTMIENLHPSDLPLAEEPLSMLFDRGHVAQVFERYADQDRKLKALLEYREFDYWVYDEHLNLVQMVEHLRGVRRTLNGSNPQHVAILLDCAWLYLLTLLHAIEAIRAVHVSQIGAGLQEYVLGGPDRMREKEQIAAVLADLQKAGQVPESVNIAPLPAYFTKMVELLTRAMRRSESSITSLRYLEFLSSAAMVGVRVGIGDAFKNSLNEIAAKIAENVVAFLVQSAELDDKLLTSARTLLVGELKRGDGKPASQPTLDGLQ